MYKVSEFCLKAVDAIYESAPKLDALVICNPEFRWLAKDIASRWSTLEIVDGAKVHWQVMQQFIMG